MIRSIPTIFLTSALWLALSEAAGSLPSDPAWEVDLSARLEPAKIYLDQQATLEVILRHPGDGAAVVFEASILPSLEGVGIGSRSTVSETHWTREGVHTQVRRQLTLVPEKTGRVAVDSLRVGWTDTATGRRDSGVVNAGELLVVQRPPVIGALLRHPRRALAGIALLAGGVGVLVWLLRRRTAVMNVEVGLSPEEVLERDWRRLRTLVKRGALGPFSEDASRSVRRFVKERYGIPAAHLPTPAIVESLENQNAPSGVVSATQKVLTFVDDMKFGLWVPTFPELEAVLAKIERLWSRGEKGTFRRARD